MLNNRLTPVSGASILPRIVCRISVVKNVTDGFFQRPAMGILSVSDFDLTILEMKVGELIHTCQQLQAENKSLRARQESLVAERAELLDKTEQAHNRVEATLSRLKAMEEQR